jgi:glyoxylase-like metal-dependent hydrolase (beta-lactamase superfamily II)
MFPVESLTLPPATHTNVYVVGAAEAVLVDPASRRAESVEVLARWVRELKKEGVKVKALVLTHHHGDHAGGAAELSRKLRVPVWAHVETAKLLGSEVEVKSELTDGERIELKGKTPTVLRAVHTPGHAPGHLCFHEERENVLLAGDMVASEGTIIVSPPEGDMKQYLESLERMREIGARAILPAHGEPIEEPEALLRHYVGHRLMREGKVLKALVEFGEPARTRDLLPAAYDDTPTEMWHFAAQSAEAHLLKLLVEGRVRRSGERWEPVG